MFRHRPFRALGTLLKLEVEVLYRPRHEDYQLTADAFSRQMPEQPLTLFLCQQE
jgi:hypothetical protein